MKFATRRDIERKFQIDAIRQAPEFAAFAGIEADLPASAFEHPALLGFSLRHAVEAAWFSRRGVNPALARLAAARAAAQFVMADTAPDRAALPDWVPAMAGDIAPGEDFLAQNFSASAAEIALIVSIWPLLGTAEALMETGGDIRLARDPRSALNGYGCSHRPRPWAITFASSTASSSSERGYAAADRARLRTTLALLRGTGRRAAVSRSLEMIRRGLHQAFALPEGSSIVLAASGTDTELLALALRHLAAGAGPIVNILIAPEETGRGVPMAARGLHFAVDTALGHDVTFEAPIAGFRADTALAKIPIRELSGTLRAATAIEADILEVMRAATRQGQNIILHALDLSKTGVLAPGPAFLRRLREEFGGGFDIVVDACQARLSPDGINAYLALDAVVLITGSKFFTGPPFAGAAILPPAVAARLQGDKKLPAGLDAYFGRDDFPARAPAASALPPVGNYGLALRWHAALAEIRAFSRVAPARRENILLDFAAVVRAAIGKNPALMLMETPNIIRHDGAEAWECCQTIFTFSLRAGAEFLTPEEARRVYLWLNTDLSPWLPGDAQVAARICHIGQPVPLPSPGGRGLQGVLRVSAGARLMSGEPSHRGLRAAARMDQEFADLRLVFDKISLLLRHWQVLCAADPAPRYRPSQNSLTVEPNRFPVT